MNLKIHMKWKRTRPKMFQLNFILFSQSRNDVRSESPTILLQISTSKAQFYVVPAAVGLYEDQACSSMLLELNYGSLSFNSSRTKFCSVQYFEEKIARSSKANSCPISFHLTAFVIDGVEVITIKSWEKVIDWRLRCDCEQQKGKNKSFKVKNKYRHRIGISVRPKADFHRKTFHPKSCNKLVYNFTIRYYYLIINLSTSSYSDGVRIFRVTLSCLFGVIYACCINWCDMKC